MTEARHWTAAEIRQLRQLFGEGMTDIHIAVRLDRTQRAVTQMRLRLGLHDPNPWLTKKLRRQFTAEAEAAAAATEDGGNG